MVSVDERPQFRALDGTAAEPPMQPGLAARRAHDYNRHGSTILWAALEIGTGTIISDTCYPRHRHRECLRFLKNVAAASSGAELHVVLEPVDCGYLIMLRRAHLGLTPSTRNCLPSTRHSAGRRR